MFWAQKEDTNADILLICSIPSTIDLSVMVSGFRVAKVLLALKIECWAEMQSRIDRVIWQSTKNGNKDQSVDIELCNGVSLQR